MKTSPIYASLNRFIHYAFPGQGKGPRPVAIVLIVLIALVVAALVLSLFALLVQWLWAWLVPDLFPSAVSAGTLAGSITWWTGFKISVALLILGSLFRGNNSTRTEHRVEKAAALNNEVVEVADDASGSARANTHVFPTLVDPLTDRELEVLQLLGKGLTNQQIAVQLNLSESTVVYHIGHIFGKLRVNSRVEAAVWAKEHGII